jgi:hypothetical protein
LGGALPKDRDQGIDETPGSELLPHSSGKAITGNLQQSTSDHAENRPDQQSASEVELKLPDIHVSY